MKIWGWGGRRFFVGGVDGVFHIQGLNVLNVEVGFGEAVELVAIDIDTGFGGHAWLSHCSMMFLDLSVVSTSKTVL